MTGAPARGRPGAEALARRMSMPLVLVLFVALAALATSGRFLAPANLANILYQASIVGVLALAQTPVVVSRGLDLSVVATLLLAGVIMGGAGSERQVMMMFDGALPYIGFWPALLAGFAAAGLVGLVNGVLSTYAGIPAFIVTLATALLVGGLVLVGTGGAPIYYPDPFYTEFGAATLLGVPAPVFVFAAVAVLVGTLLSATTFGRRLYAVGANEKAARFSGVEVERVRLAAFVLCSLLSAVAGLLFLSRTGYVATSSGGDLLLTALGNFMNLMLISPHLQYAINGAIILAAIMLHTSLAPAEA